MYREHSIAVVVPAYCEELLIQPTLTTIPLYVDRIYAVNDCSPDKTGEIIDQCARSDPRIIPVHHPRNMGVGGAIISGYKKALFDGFNIVAVMAGDNQMDPEFLPKLIDPIIAGNVDYERYEKYPNPLYP